MDTTCRLCASPNNKVKYTINEYSILECDECGFAFASPLDSHELIHNLYKRNYFNNADAKGYADYEKDAGIRDATFTYYFDLIEKQVVNKHSVLDIGCADGSFLRVTRANGYECNDGIELNEEMFTATSKEFTLYNQPLEFIAIEKKYDLVTLFDVLEHIPDLKTVCQKLYTLTNTNGLLVILTPDYGSIARKIKGKNWFQFKPPEHINYFSGSSLSQLISGHGFEIVHLSKGVSIVDHEFIKGRLKRYNYSFLSFLFSMFGKLFFIGKKHIKISNSALFLIAKRVG